MENCERKNAEETFIAHVKNGTLNPATRETNYNFTELEEWEGASQGLEAYNIDTQTWVEIYPAQQ